MTPEFASIWLWVPGVWLVLFLLVWAQPARRFTRWDPFTAALITGSFFLARYLP